MIGPRIGLENLPGLNQRHSTAAWRYQAPQLPAKFRNEFYSLVTIRSVTDNIESVSFEQSFQPLANDDMIIG